MTGAGRDRSVDAVRAFAITGVVLGHWLVTGLVVRSDHALHQASPLSAMPGLAPATWVLQTLGLFFFAGGFAAAASHRRRWPGSATTAAGRRLVPRWLVPRWLVPRRLVPRRLLLPLAVVVGGWAVVLGVAAALDVPGRTLWTVGKLVVSPLWFLLPYLLLSAASGPLIRLVDRAGPVVALAGVPVVVLCDAGVAPGWLAVPAAWSVPWLLGIALARDRLRLRLRHGGGASRNGGDTARSGGGPAAGKSACDGATPGESAVPSGRARDVAGRTAWPGLAMLITGAGAMALLIITFGYPASAVGVPGQGRSNLNPPSLVAVTLAVAQIGAFLIVRRQLCRLPDSFLALNRFAIPIYLGHQSVLVLVTTIFATAGWTAPGLLTAPDGPAWTLHRAAWIPVLAAILAVVVGFIPARSSGRRHAPARRSL